MNRKLYWILLTLLIFFVAMTTGRLFLFFSSGFFHGLSRNILWAFALGARYDFRELGILAVLMILLPLIRPLDPQRSNSGRKIWTILLSVLSILLVFLYIVDTMHFDYLAQRLNASVLNFIPEGATSAQMVWQTYPVIRILLLIALLSTAIIFLVVRTLRTASLREPPTNKRMNVMLQIALFLLAGLGIFGRIGQYPLRWSDAFQLGDSRLSQLALNPIQSFFSSMSFRHVSYDEQTVRKYYPIVAEYLGAGNTHSVNPTFTRIVTGTGAAKPNIVLVICESFSAYKSSMWGNPLNTTPYFNSLCSNGVFFARCFTPHFGTARGVWATITGIPDVLLEKTASRDPVIVDQHTVMDDFAGYEKDYFIGGSTSWANIKGVLSNNIAGINIHEQGNYAAEKVDVWGISDKNLFLQANEVLKNKTGPFFTIIQTSDNHRPYTIPKEDIGAFKPVTYTMDSLVKYGFQSNEELNAFRYTDFCFQAFIEAAKKEKYFSNTLFVFVGDHGIRGNAGDMFPRAWTSNALTAFHVPLLFYAPALLHPARHSMVCSQVDVLPTIAGVAGISYSNATLGRDLLHLGDTTSNVAFIIDHDVRNIAVVKGDYLFQHQLTDNREMLVPLSGNEPVTDNMKNQVSGSMRDLTLAFYEISKYMLFNNRKTAR
jgi:phosphoglycerol transferase MdoB-like AlkP superfamily enzyme